MKKIISQKRLKELLHYDPKTGLFTWIKPLANCMKKGDIAGHINSYKYNVIMVKAKYYRASRLAWFYMTGKWPLFEIDHINRIRHDDRWCNLRQATHAENMRNRSLYKNNKSGFAGVFWNNTTRKWLARIRINNKMTHLGTFLNKADAIKSRLAAEKYVFF